MCDTRVRTDGAEAGGRDRSRWPGPKPVAGGLGFEVGLY